jgi:hypothetical protein
MPTQNNSAGKNYETQIAFRQKCRIDVGMHCIIGGGALTVPVAVAEPAASVRAKLTPKLQNLLKTEMTQIAVSASKIASAIATGHHGAVAQEATDIADGLILKRSLTDQDKKDLKRAAPAAFLKLDATFHQTAKQLAQAAVKKDSELETFDLSKMLGYCVSCHATYASDKFVGFIK